MHVSLEPRNPNLLSRQTQLDALNSNFRTAKADYYNSNFVQLLQTLTDDLKDKLSLSSTSGKAAAKDKFTRFFDMLDEISERLIEW
jgi:exocyst complex protein 7